MLSARVHEPPRVVSSRSYTFVSRLQMKYYTRCLSRVWRAWRVQYTHNNMPAAPETVEICWGRMECVCLFIMFVCASRTNGSRKICSPRGISVRKVCHQGSVLNTVLVMAIDARFPGQRTGYIVLLYTTRIRALCYVFFVAVSGRASLGFLASRPHARTWNIMGSVLRFRRRPVHRLTYITAYGHHVLNCKCTHTNVHLYMRIC